jgi:ribosome-binding protein aMBF1 (putative translation factor)
MKTDALTNSLRPLSPEEQALVLAITVVLERLTRLSEADSADMFELFKCYKNAATDEERIAAHEAMLELLEKTSTKVRRLELAEDEDGPPDENGPPDELRKWLDYVSGQIRTRRKEANLTQEQLAERSGLPQSHISRIENGRHSPSRATLEKIARALNLAVSEFDPSA